MNNTQRRSSILSQGTDRQPEQIGSLAGQAGPIQLSRSRSKIELQRRLQEVGQGLHHGAKGLPGVQKGLVRNLSQQAMFVQYDVPGQKKKVLVPSNVPYRVKIPRKGPETDRVFSKRNSAHGSRQHSGAGTGRRYAGDHEGGENNQFTFYEQSPDLRKNSNPISGNLIAGQGASSKYHLRTLNDEQLGSGKVPKILNLHQLNRIDDPNYAGGDDRQFEATGKVPTMPRLTLPLSQSHNALNTERPNATQSFLNATISSREIHNPQFQKLNMAPYLKESREFVKARGAQRAGSRGAVKSALAGLDGANDGAPTAFTHRGTFEPSSTADLQSHTLQGKIPKRVKGGKGLESSTPSHLLMTNSHSKPVLSQMTGLSTMAPLGPAMGNLRSLSKSKIEQHSHRLSTQRGLGQASKQNILLQIEQKAIQRQIHDPSCAVVDGSETPNSNTLLLERIQASKHEKNAIDAKFAQIRLKLKEEQQEKGEYFQYMQNMSGANSRHNVIPGDTELKDEAIRQQMLIGKLRNSQRFPGGFGAGTAEPGAFENHRYSEHGEVGRGYREPEDGYDDVRPIQTPSDLSLAGGSSTNQPGYFLGQTKETLEYLEQQRKQNAMSRHSGLAVNSTHSRGIPEVLSDQGSGASAISSSLGVSGELAGNPGKPKSRQVSKQRANAEVRDHIINKVPSRRGLGHINRTRDYKPHDHQNLEESPEAKQFGGFFDEKGNNNKGAVFMSTFKEPEPEMMKKDHNSQEREEENAMDTQLYLENLICQIQNDKTQNSGYFIYLRQNKANPKNPYDLVPFKFKEKRDKSDVKALPDESQGNRANTNLHVIENYHKNRSKQILQKDQKAPSKISNENTTSNKYYTLSKQGITTFLNNEPIEFTKIENWLAERAQFNQISQKKFFKKFRSWKIMRMWRLNILSAKREAVTADLKGKLFMADSVFGQILLQHRFACKDLEKLRVLDFQQPNRDAFEHEQFKDQQRSVRNCVEKAIREASNKTRDLFKGGINEILDALRAKIHKQDEIDQQEEMAASIKIDNSANSFNKNTANSANEFRLMRQIEKLDSNKNLNQDPVYEQLGFKHNLKFSARSELREACKKFLRFGFLLDFIALESLSNIYLNSIHDCVDKLKVQVHTEVSYDLESSAREQAFTESKKEPDQKKGGSRKTMEEIDNNPADMQIPLFFADCLYKEKQIPPQNMYTDLLEPFVLPPMGNSREKDFNPMAHLEIEAVAPGSDFEDGNGSKQSDHDDKDRESEDSEDVKLEVTKVKGLNTLWLNIYPDKQALSALIKETFQLGFDSLKNFEKWSMHADLKPYDQVLEPWDYRSYERWEPPNEENELTLNCDEWLQENAQYQHLEDNIEKLITKAMQHIKKQFERLEPILQDYWTNKQLGDFKILTHERLKNPNELLPILLQRFVNQKDEFANFMPQSKDLGLLRVKFNELISALSPQPKHCLDKLKEILPKTIKSRIQTIKKWMEEQIKTLKVFPTNVDEYVSQIQCLEYIDDNYQDVKDQVELNDQIFQICERFELPNREDKSSKFIDEIYQLINTLNNAIYDTKDASDRRKEQMKTDIQKQIPKLNFAVQSLLEKVNNDKFLRIEGANVSDILCELNTLEVDMDEVVVKKKNIHRYQKTLDMGMVEPFNNVEDAKVLLSHHVRLWTAIHEWNENIQIWQVSPFEEIDVEEILDKSQKHARTVLLCERNLPEGSTAVQYLKEMVFDFQATMPTVEALANEQLEDVHWQEIKAILNIPTFPLEEKQFSLGDLVNLNVAKYADEIVNISVTATQESDLRKSLGALSAQWSKEQFVLVKHQRKIVNDNSDKNKVIDKEAYKLDGVDAIQAALDESLQTSSLIVGSRYVKRLQREAQDMQDGLNLIYDTLEQWRECQRNWLYLENLFSGDIRKDKNRQTDLQEYENIDKHWNKLMKAAHRKRGVRDQCTPQRLHDFMKWNKTMDTIQKNLEEYLEEKRAAFPRFYFISNDELLQILANSADLKAIEKHTNKCFENVSSYILQDEPDIPDREKQLQAMEMEAQKPTSGSQEGGFESKKSNNNTGNHNSRRSQENDGNQRQKTNTKSIGNSVDMASEHLDDSECYIIYGIQATQQEKVKFVGSKKTLKIRGLGAESWLKALEEYMVHAIQQKIKDAYNKYYDDLAQEGDRNSWVLNHLAQAVAVVDQVTWAEGTEMALNDLREENPFAMEDHLTVMKEQLAQLTELIRGKLTAIQRMSLVALITQDVHCRDIVEQLHIKNVQSTFDFLWQQQLRYHLEEEGVSEPRVILRQVNSQLPYGYEYMGPTSRLVITPLTDKCWITITGAMHIKLGAAPAGPAGTGKTESTKDLAKACGIFCIVINCSDQIEYKIMAKLFSGLVQTGAWSCLDEFNRINIEVLSVIAQQLLDIKEAKVQGKERFIFNEQERTLKQQCGVFITMNPGYAGRTELPDNLKVLFRPVSMMIPNYGLIAEIMLFAEGFSEAKALSTKMVQLYKLASEQLSQQDHYDFGLRAVKSVLVMAGNLKRAYPELQENIVLIRAMRDSNIPKFLAADLPLFSALIQDLFPGVEIPQTQHAELEHQIVQSLESMKLQKVDKLNAKVVQLFETLNVRFGVMIVGPTGGGKTTTYKVLADSMTKLRLQANSKDQRFQNVKLKILNPKSISMGELYGEENIDTQEWTDGLASKILRKFAQVKDPDRKNWCVLDGPVDALWIENMNTVLDDNMTLCLVNGERIKLNHSIRILFEVQDLAVASPATVSRCGMVYITPSDLGWRPYFNSWIQNYISRFLTDQKLAFLISLFEMFVDLGFEKMQPLRDRETLPTQESQNVQCLCNFLEHFIKDQKIQQEEKKDVWQKQLNSVFAFSMIWGVGPSFDKSAHRHLDNIFRDFFGKLHIPPKETVFQYFYHEKEMRFRPWDQVLADFETRIVAPYDQLYVPTIDSVSYTKILSHLTGIDKKTFFTGTTGVGKSIIIQEFIHQNYQKENFAPIVLNFSAQTSSISVQKGIESKLEKKRGKKVIGAKGNQHALIFIDDINMPSVEQYGAQPPIEFLRLLLDANIVYDRPNFFKKQIENFKIICAAAPPGGGRARLTPRFMRHFHIINVPNASEEILSNIFETIISEFLTKNHFSEPVRKCGNIAVAATIDMFTQFNQNMLPIPSRFHYQFNMRDVSKVFQGILMTKPQSVVDSKVFTKLWLHECQRVFHDRLIDDKDRQYFKDLSMELIKTKFKENWTQEELFDTNIELNQLKVTFSMILKCDYDEKLYEQIVDPKRLLKVLEDKMLDYNFTFTSSQMSLIFFEDAIDHICRIARILNQPRGNAMLIGVSGSGKQSLTRLAAFLHEASCSTIKLSKNYKPANFRDDIKKSLLDSGCDRKPNVFLLADTQIIHEQFLEDISCVLNTGEIADLYEKEDFERMEISLAKFMKEQGIPQSQEDIYQTFIKELRLNCHIILCMSPVGDQLRVRCRNFPSLVNCCTLDWFDNWPEQALRTVSVQFFKTNLMIKDDDSLRQSIAEMFPKVHASVQELATRFYDEQKRRIYITPKTYLDALNLFRQQLDDKQQQLNQKLNRLKNGINKLEVTNEQIAELQITLTDLVPKLKEKNEAAEIQASEIQEQTILAQKREQETEHEARIVMHEAKQIQNLKEKADYEVDKAKPALRRAETAVNELSKADIAELKSFKDGQNKAVQLALECTLIYLGHKTYDWKIAQKALADIKFLEKLKTYDRDSVPDKILKKVKELTKHADFKLEAMEKSSKAAAGLAKWCKAIREYAESLLIVKPLLAQQAKMTEELKEAQQSVDNKQKDLAQIKKRLSDLQDDYQDTLALIQALKNEKILCEKRLANASKLLELLVNEGARWKIGIGLISDQLKKIIGDVFISVSQMSYLGPFTGQYREMLLNKWTRRCVEYKIELSQDYSLVNTLGDPIEIRKWRIYGLPNDSVSVDNAIYTMNTQRWPMLIDPQSQGNSWLKKMFKSEGADKFRVLKVEKTSQSVASNRHFAKTLEEVVRSGYTLILEDMPEEVDASIDQIVSKAIFKEDGIFKIVLGTRSIEYDPNFKLYLTTKMANPHFLPEVSIKLSVINFTVTFDGLDDQLLADVVQNLEPQVERVRDQLVIEISAVKNEQAAIQASILASLAESNQDTILDNEILIQTLQTSKTKSGEISKSLKRSEEIEKTVQEKREQYRPISVRGSILYFVIASLTGIDPMYQNSLGYVRKIFVDTIQKVVRARTKSPSIVDVLDQTNRSSGGASNAKDENGQDPNAGDLEIQNQLTDDNVERSSRASANNAQREDEKINESDQTNANILEQPLQQVDLGDIDELLAELLENITANLYVNICRGLFEAHKLIYSFLICTSISKNSGDIANETYNLLLRGQGVFDRSGQLDYVDYEVVHDILTELQWDLAYAMELKLSKHFSGLVRKIVDNHLEIKEYLQTDPEESASLLDMLPSCLTRSLPTFEQLLLIKLLRPQQMLYTLKEYVIRDLGRQYSVSPLTSMEILFESSDKATPIIFVLSQGADPNEQILGYAKKMKRRLQQKSLGQGQELDAERRVREGQRDGDWILLQNCHLFKSWMPQLEAICNSMQEDPELIHPDFRLILTSMPQDYFPASVLQNGVKMTTEPPQGLKANLKRIFTNIIDKDTYELTDLLNQDAQHSRDNQQQLNALSISQASEHSGGTNRSKPLAVKAARLADLDRQFDLAKCWKSLVFGLSFFHSIIQERKKFGSIGWNVRYEFNDSDLDTSIKMLRNFIEEAEEIPWDSMQFMTGHINYGGRVTDDNDRILLMSLLKNCNSLQIIDPSYINALSPQKKRSSIVKRKKVEKPFQFSFFNCPMYTMPKPNQGLDDVIQFIDSLPNSDMPEIFGMHKNASISYQQNESNNLIRTIQSVQMQPVVSDKPVKTESVTKKKTKRITAEQYESNHGEINFIGKGKTLKQQSNENQDQQIKMSMDQEDFKSPNTEISDDEIVIGIAKDLFDNRPMVISQEGHSKEIFKINSLGLLHCYSIVLLQEQERYNRLIKTISESLENLIKAVQGIILMSPQLDQMYTCLLQNRVPANWEAVSYSSRKPLASWYQDLHKRVEFMQMWLKKGHPNAYWLSGFFFPQGFITGVLQAYARKHQKAIDFLKFKFNSLDLRTERRNAQKEKSSSTEKEGRNSHCQTDIPDQDLITQQPADGVYIYGLYIESAAWSEAKGCIIEQRPGVIISSMPIVHFLPFEVKHKAVKKSYAPPVKMVEQNKDLQKDGNQQDLVDRRVSMRPPPKARKSTQQRRQEQKTVPESVGECKFEGESDTDLDNPSKYLCPLYKTAARAGVLSTTGQSTNYILSASLPIDVKERNSEHWTLRGTAIVTMLDD